MNNSLVSIIVPTKNSSRLLEKCLESIKNQTYKNLEIIVVDNNSTDDTKRIAKKYTDKVFNFGPERSAQVNYGVSQAVGEFVYKVDSDFVLAEKVVEECISKINEGFDAVVVHNTPDKTISWIAKIRKFEVDMYKYDITHSSARFLKKDVYAAIHGFNEKMTAGEDYDFQNKLNRGGFKTGFIEAEALHLGEPTNFWRHMKKYYTYGKDFVNYREENGAESKQQLSFGRSVYFKHRKKFIEHPLMGMEFIVYNIFKFAFGGMGYLVGKKREVKGYLILFLITGFVFAYIGFTTISTIGTKPVAQNDNATVIHNTRLSVAEVNNFVAPATVPSELKTKLMNCDSVRGWQLDTNGAGLGTVEDKAIKYVRVADKARGWMSHLRYDFGAVKDLSEGKMLSFQYKWDNPKNQLKVQWLNVSGHTIGSQNVGANVEANIWHTAVMPFLGYDLSDINGFDLYNDGDKYPGWKNGESSTLWIRDVETIAPVNKSKSKKIVIQFDDGYADNYVNAFPLFSKYHKVATVGVVTDWIGKTYGNEGEADMLSAQQIRELYAGGWEIASHTKNHTNMRASQTTIETQMSASIQALADIGVSCTHLIYPFTEYSELSENVASNYFKSATVGVLPNQNFLDYQTNYGNIDKYRLNRQAVEITKSVETVEQYVRDSIQYNSLLILYFHDVNDNGGENSWPTDRLEELLKWLDQEGVETMTTTQAVEYYGL